MKRREGVKGSRSTYISILLIIVIISGISAFYMSFYKVDKCYSFECFQEEMRECNKVSYINDDSQAFWEYNVIGKKDRLCMVRVKLVNAKEGSLNIDKLVGYDMLCGYPIGVGTYPEKDLKRCHGALREEFQEIMIKKLHTYVIENLGEINSSLSEFR